MQILQIQPVFDSKKFHSIQSSNNNALMNKRYDFHTCVSMNYVRDIQHSTWVAKKTLQIQPVFVFLRTSIWVKLQCLGFTQNHHNCHTFALGNIMSIFSMSNMGHLVNWQHKCLLKGKWWFYLFELLEKFQMLKQEINTSPIRPLRMQKSKEYG